MTSRTHTLWDALRTRWASLTGKHPDASTLPPVVIHDPAAQRAQDLDDPFIDASAQARVADVISRARRKDG